MPTDPPLASGPGDTRLMAARLALVSASLFWSGNFVVGRVVGGTIDPITMNTMRWCVGILLFLPFVGQPLWAHRHLLRRYWAIILGLSLTGIVAFQTLDYRALVEIPVVQGVLMLSTTPLIILCGSALLGRTRISPTDALAVFLSVVGVAILMSNGHIAELSQFRVSSGDLWMLGAVLAWSIYTLLLQNKPVDLPGNVIFAATIIVGLPPLLFGMAWAGTTDLTSLSLVNWSLVAYVSVFPSVLAYLAWNFGVARLGPEAAGFFINLMPVFATILAYLILGEAISAPQLIGAILIVGAIVLMRRRSG